jgi:hypothetical protein
MDTEKDSNTMRYAIIINLDYENHPESTLKFLWSEIKDAMITAGFHRDGRIFTISLPKHEATQLATRVIDDIEGHLAFDRKHLYTYFRDFYGYAIECTTNLMVPAINGIVVGKGSKDSGVPA